jgi:hypothetical protein
LATNRKATPPSLVYTPLEASLEATSLDVSRKATHVYIEDAQGRRVTRGIVATMPTGLAQAVERYATSITTPMAVMEGI